MSETKVGQEKRELLFDVQAPLPEVSLANLTFAQRQVFDAVTRFVVGTTLAWVSISELFSDVQRLRTKGAGNVGRQLANES